MLRCIKKLREEHQETIVLKVLERLENHPNFQGLIRYTWHEMQNLLAHQNRLQSTQPDIVFLEFRSRLTQAETNILDVLPRLGIDTEKYKALERQHSTLTEKATRYVADLLAVVLKEEKLKKDFESLQSARSRVGMGDDVSHAIEHRFARTPQGEVKLG